MKILLADDSMTAQNMGKKILTEAGYEVVAVSNGAAAVKKIAEQRPDVAVLDVYMPGYTGLEVCERLKSARDTTHMPVLLTVGRMEPFKPEEGNRVKADGIIIKPFEASDLLAAIQKIEQRMPPRAVAAAVAGEETTYEKTQKIRIPYLEEFKDASYEEWKGSAPAHVDDGDHRAGAPAVPAFSVPEGLEGAPAMGMDELEIVPSFGTEVHQRPTQPLDSQPAPQLRTGTTQLDPATALATGATATTGGVKSTSGVWRALDKAREWFGAPGGVEAAGTAAAPQPEQAVEASGATVQELALPSRPGAESEYEKTQYYPKRASDSPQSSTPAHAGDLLEYTSAEPVDAVAANDPHFEATASPQFESAEEILLDPNLEPTLHAKDTVRVVSQDPALVTDVSQLARDFPTRFGVANTEVVPVAKASDFPELYADSANAASAAWQDEDEELEALQPAELSEEAPIPAAAPPAGNSRSLVQPPKAGWVAEEAPLEAHENSVKLHDEMNKIFRPGAPSPEPEVEVELMEPGSESLEAQAAEVGSAVDPELAAAMAAAVGAEIAPAVAHLTMETGASDEAPEKHTALAADIVHRVTEMLKPELIKRIAAELSRKK